jgi:hypothetical protein
MTDKREKNAAGSDISDSGIERIPGARVGSVPEAPRNADETTADDPAVASGVAREEHPTSSASGISADDEDAGEERKKAYRNGATLVSRLD